MEVSKEEKQVPLNPHWEWVAEKREYLHTLKDEIHPAVFDMAVKMLHGVAEMHATDRPHIHLFRYKGGTTGLRFVWSSKESPLCGFGVEISAPAETAAAYEQYNPWTPVHPKGVWK